MQAEIEKGSRKQSRSKEKEKAGMYSNLNAMYICNQLRRKEEKAKGMGKNEKAKKRKKEGNLMET